ncbi:MAG TPA: CGNR zinc finger domain-containing protein [Ornithinibacter sp.]|nr:CGNR zinc finger domain-containing protein [Ornithinibacter sp.]
MTGVHLAVDLVNAYSEKPWPATDLESILRDHAIRRCHATAPIARELHRWTARLRAVFEAADVDARCRAVNNLLAEGTSSAYLTTHDGLRPHLHFAAEVDDVASRVKAVTAGGLALFSVEAEGQRLGVCAAPGCTTAFVDTSRNGRRGYCTARCGNTVAVRLHRERRA